MRYFIGKNGFIKVRVISILIPVHRLPSFAMPPVVTVSASSLQAFHE